jgi:hypothetical protein
MLTLRGEEIIFIVVQAELVIGENYCVEYMSKRAI